jgi:hypothetical protein
MTGSDPVVKPDTSDMVLATVLARFFNLGNYEVEVRDDRKSKKVTFASDPTARAMSEKRRFVLKDAEGKAPDLEVEVECDGLALWVRPVGYGNNAFQDGHGSPILLENRGGTPNLRVWSDINQEEATHRVNLEGASEKERR